MLLPPPINVLPEETSDYVTELAWDLVIWDLNPRSLCAVALIAAVAEEASFDGALVSFVRLAFTQVGGVTDRTGCQRTE